MNDRFKLRFFDVRSKEYLYPDADGWMFIKETQSRVNIHDLLYDDRKEVIPEQCTGLSDKNGTLIFEGDIVRVNDYRNGFSIDYKRQEKKNEVVGLGVSGTYINPFGLTFNKNETEVIGNIHENREHKENE